MHFVSASLGINLLHSLVQLAAQVISLAFLLKAVTLRSQPEHSCLKFQLVSCFPSPHKVRTFVYKQVITRKIRSQFHCTDFNTMHNPNQLLKGKNLSCKLFYVLRRSQRKTSRRKFRGIRTSQGMQSPPV